MRSSTNNFSRSGNNQAIQQNASPLAAQCALLRDELRLEVGCALLPSLCGHSTLLQKGSDRCRQEVLSKALFPVQSRGRCPCRRVAQPILEVCWLLPLPHLVVLQDAARAEACRLWCCHLALVQCKQSGTADRCTRKDGIRVGCKCQAPSPGLRCEMHQKMPGPDRP